MKKDLQKLKSIIIEHTKHYNNKLCKRRCKLEYKDVIYYLFELIQSAKKSSTLVASQIKIDNINDASKSAYLKKRKKIPHLYVQELFNKLLNFYYSVNNNLLFNKYRILSVDGTHKPLPKELKSEGFSLVKKKTYVNGLVSGIYDHLNNTIIDLLLTTSKSERDVYELQFNHLTKNDIVIHDRGYYNDSLFYGLHEKGIKVVFRMKRNKECVDKFIKDNNIHDRIVTLNNNETNFENVKMRLVKYFIKGNIYVLATNLFDKKFTIEILKKIYGYRWDIEVYFKAIKYDLSFSVVHSKSCNLILQEVKTHQCYTLLTRIVENIFIKHKNVDLGNNKTNFKNNLDKMTQIIKHILYTKKNIYNSIITILNILFEHLVKIRENRSFDRKRITPVKNWYWKDIT